MKIRRERAEIEATRCRKLGVLAFALALVVTLSGCATEPPAPPKEPAPSKVDAPPQPSPSPPAPVVATPSPEQARFLTREALEPLQAGDETTARTMLEQAQKLDPAYELPRKLLQQIASDPQQDYGTTSFPYRVERGDTLASIAQRFLNDRYLFYALAKYNEIKVPKSLHVGQTIRIWGKAPKVVPPKPAIADLRPPEPSKQAEAPSVPDPHKTKAPEAPKPVEPPVSEPPKPKPLDVARVDADRLVAQGREQQKAGSYDSAVRSYDAALKRDPAHPEAAHLAAAARKEQAGMLHKEATAEFSKQNLCRAIVLWDRTIAIDPEQRLAVAKRAQALDLRDKLCKIDETRCCALAR